jgi:predicted aldo/keto reductase-like oxidoreductase
MVDVHRARGHDAGAARGGIDRREFLRRGALAAAAALAPAAAAAAPEPEPAAEPRVRRRTVLGRTGLRISDVSFGSSRLRGDEEIVRHALARGIDYFDTAESYGGGESERTLGRALRGRRDEVVLASKVECGARDSRERLMRALEGSLERLGTDRIDVYFNHAVNEPERLANPEWLAFAERAKAQGKIRFTGMSGHGGRLVECLDFALDRDLVDVVLVAHNFGQDPAFYERFTRGFDFVAVQPDLPRVLAKAKARGVGVVAMKTLRGARLNDLRAYETGGATFAQAALRWTLSNPSVDAAIVSMTSRELVDELLGASGWDRAHPADAGLLLRYAHRTARSQCRYGCRACEGACPAGVPIPDVLRARMYAWDYGDHELARSAYAELGAGAAACLSCAARPCASACPHGLPLAELTAPVHRRLA